jgi:hypothetical protein
MERPLKFDCFRKPTYDDCFDITDSSSKKYGHNSLSGKR